MQKIKIEARTPEETFEAFEAVMEAGSFPKATMFDEKLVVESTHVALRESLENPRKRYGGRRGMIVDYITSSDDAMDFFKKRGIDVEDELL